MKNTAQILVVVDPTAKDQPAFRRAIELAPRLGASLKLVICDRDPVWQGRVVASPPALENARAALEVEHGQRLEQLAEEATAALGAAGPLVTTKVRWDYPLADGIIREANESHADLVLKDTHYHGPIRRTIFSNTDWELIRHCPCPLWLVRPDTDLTPARIVAAVAATGKTKSGESLDHRILNSASALSRQLDANLDVFHAYPLPVFSGAAIVPGPTATAASTADALVADAETEHREEIERLMRDCGLDEANLVLRDGSARSLLVAYAEERAASLVVMGAVSQNMLERVVIGSTAESVLDRLPCDLLIVK